MEIRRQLVKCRLMIFLYCQQVDSYSDFEGRPDFGISWTWSKLRHVDSILLTALWVLGNRSRWVSLNISFIHWKSNHARNFRYNNISIFAISRLTNNLKFLFHSKTETFLVYFYSQPNSWMIKLNFRGPVYTLR